MICFQTSRRPTPGSGYFRITQKSPRKLYQPKSISQPITQLALCFLSKYKALEHPILTHTFFGKGTLSYWYFIFHIEVLQKITNDKFARHIEDPPNVCVTSKIFPENTHLSSLFLSHLQPTYLSITPFDVPVQDEHTGDWIRWSGKKHLKPLSNSTN